MPAFDEPTKARIRYHLGYPGVDATLVAQGGSYSIGQAAFQIEYALNNVPVFTVTKTTGLLDIMDVIETQMVSALQRLQADKADVVTLNKTEHLDLLVQYKYWQRRVARQLNVSVYDGDDAGGLNFTIVR